MRSIFRFAITSLVYLFWARAMFLVWNWSFFKTQSTADIFWAFLNGVRFDWMSVSLVAVLFYLLSWLLPDRKWSRYIIILPPFFLMLIVLIFSLGDSEYVHLNGRRLTKDSLFIFSEVPGKFFQIVWAYKYLFLASCALLILYSKSVFRIINVKKAKRTALFKKAFIFVFFAAGVRGGFQMKPLGFTQAQIFPNPMMNNLVLNSGFTVLKTFQKQSLPREKYFESREEMLSHLPGNKEIATPKFSHAQPQNVVIIILESFNLEYTEDYTPFFNELSKKGLLFTNAFANARRSIEGVAAILAGIPALMNEPFINSQYMTNYYLGLGTLLSQKNYHTSFFHGAKNGTMYFDSFTKSAGIQNYFGLNEYPNKDDFDGTWGIWDEPFLQWTADQIKQFPQPFFSTIFTLSSHNPFKVPKAYETKLPKGNLDVHQSIAYTDQALKKFFERIENEEWYKNTLFILVADHTYKSYKPKYQNELGNYRIPILFFHPTQVWHSVDTKVPISQIDILPSILNYLDIDEAKRSYLSSSVFAKNPKRYVTLLSDQKYLLVDEKGLNEASISVEISDPRLKAVRQYFSEGMWDNRLYYPAK